MENVLYPAVYLCFQYIPWPENRGLPSLLKFEYMHWPVYILEEDKEQQIHCVAILNTNMADNGNVVNARYLGMLPMDSLALKT